MANRTFGRPYMASILIMTALWTAAADRASENEGAPLPENERRQITTDLLTQYPDLAGSPGIKFAEAPIDREGKIGIRVIYYPHSESRGIKEAYQASCAWQAPTKTWSCYKVVVRRYLTLPSQDFEVRLYADFAADTALAIIESSRRELEFALSNGLDRPDTAIIIRPRDDAYVIAWGNEDGYGSLDIKVALSPGGDPTNPDDWLANIY